MASGAAKLLLSPVGRNPHRFGAALSALSSSYSSGRAAGGRGRSMDDDVSADSQGETLGCRSYPPEELFDHPPLQRRMSTVEDEQRGISYLKEVIALQEKNVSSWIVENKVRTLVLYYKCLFKPHKEGFLKVLATDYSVNHERIHKAMNQFKDFPPGSTVSLKAEEQLKAVLTPQYSWLFKTIGRLEAGVKFLVDLRTDVLVLLSEMDSKSPSFIPLQQLNATLKDLLSLWFSVGFLSLERVTWKSPCEMLQKISEYEAVHPVRSWADLKRRVGSYRRCFVYTHSAMPCEPIVVLHTALCTEIASSMKGIVAATQRMSVDANSMSGLIGVGQEIEDPCQVTAAIFYSITSTQQGLQGIELGNYLIKRVVRELQTEFPNMTLFSSLSPIPNFKNWLMEKFKSMEKDEGGLPVEQWTPVVEKLGSWKELKRHIHNNTWHHDANLVAILEQPLMSTCAYYLFKEKRRGAALDNVANFHLRNGAVMWRLNWLADTSPRGMTNSCGLMVNYRYFLDDTETNSRNYLENKVINASDQIKKLVDKQIPAKM
ncbi:malonyl-CoA decarboxylase, mitochondrial-like [Cimex lectularius]|uniref:Malonyl-CoA decarboxylase n=1 Tax=Cimex lectularius TaxID=79782 RepID=A0A8I6SNY4_CIMLE|nr:malonyl-CoA decarboxylase, mitochondrial-like [Cimex lectularius]